MRARIEPVAGGGDLDIPMPVMAPAYRVSAQQRRPGGGMDPATRRLAIFAGGIGGALLLLFGVWSLGGHRHAGVPVIQADSRPLRVRPANPGGMQIAGANDAILSGDQDSKVAMAPPPEAPEPQALKAEEQAAATAAKPPLPAPTPASTAMATAIPPPPPVPAAPARAAAPAAGHPAPAAVAAKPAGAMVQLAALETEDRARAEWHRLDHRYRDLLGSRTPTFSRTEHAGKTFWRVRVGGFADVADAARFCGRVKAKGGGCSVASF